MAMITISHTELRQFADLDMKETVENLTLLGVPVESVVGEELALEITPNRPDLLSIEGVGRALAAFAFSKNRQYSSAAAAANDSITIDSSVAKIRPVIGAGIVRGAQIDDDAIKSLMQLQEKLHDTLGRKRKKLAIGVHDLTKVKFPLVYKAVGLEDIAFVPLDTEEKMTAKQILEKHPKGVAYKHLVGEKCALIIDANNEVVSLPPIINADRTRLKAGAKDLLVEVTGTSEEAVKGALNIVLCSLADRGGKISSVRIGKESSPNLTGKRMMLPAESANKLLGTDFSKEEIAKMLVRMGYSADAKKDEVNVPPFRTDVLHEVDLIEDIAVAYDFNKFEPTLPNFFSIGKKKAQSAAHEVLIGLGFDEVITWTLSSKKAIAKALLPESKLVEIANPLTEDFTLMRPSLIPSLLTVLSESKKEKQPQKVYEIGTVATPELEERIGCCMLDSRSSFSNIKSVAVCLLNELGIDYEIREGKHPSFIEGRCAEIVVGKKIVGVFGEIAPQVLNNFDLEQPVSLLEMKSI